MIAFLQVSLVVSVVPQTPSPLLIRLAAHPPDAIAVVDLDGTRTSYGALARGIRRGGSGARGAGVGPGWAVAFLVEPGALFVETLVAIWRAGGIAVPLSPLHTAPELAHVVEDAAPRVLVASAALAPRLAGMVSPKTGERPARRARNPARRDLAPLSGDGGGDFPSLSPACRQLTATATR